MKPTTLRSGAFTLHRLLSIHDDLHSLSGTALVLSIDALDTRESHRLALLLLDFMALSPEALELTADALPDRLLRTAISTAAEALSEQKKNEKEKSALSLPLNPSYSPKKKNKEKEKAAATSCERACEAVTDGSACCAVTSEGQAVTDGSDAHGGDVSKTSQFYTSATETSATEAEAQENLIEPKTPSRRHARVSVKPTYIDWTPEEFMRTARNCRGEEMDDDSFKAFCLYWLQTDPRGVCLFQQQRRFSMVQRMNSWTRRDLRRKYETDQRLERTYGPAPAPAPAPPTLEEVVDLARTEGLDTADCERFHQYHTAYGWTLNGRPIASWQAALRIWCARGKHSNPQNNETTPNPHTTPAARPSQRSATDSNNHFQQRVDDIFDEAIRRNRNENNEPNEPNEPQDNHDEHPEHPDTEHNEHDGNEGK